MARDPFYHWKMHLWRSHVKKCGLCSLMKFWCQLQRSLPLQQIKCNHKINVRVRDLGVNTVINLVIQRTSAGKLTVNQLIGSPEGIRIGVSIQPNSCKNSLPLLVLQPLSYQSKSNKLSNTAALPDKLLLVNNQTPLLGLVLLTQSGKLHSAFSVSSQPSWIIDSGGSDHMTEDLSLFCS